MKAAYIEKFGGPEVFKYGELPDPAPVPGDVVIDIVAASVNAADWQFRAGHYSKQRKTNFPQILGRDFSGIVSATGDSDFQAGDEVFGVLDLGHEGTYCEKIAIKASIVAKKPSRISHVNAAASALGGLTAVKSIEDTLQLKRGETILILGGAGGVAGFAIGLAKHIGARVITTTSTVNRDYVQALGADKIIDYNTQDFTKLARDCDAVFDTVGGEGAQKSFSVLRPGGRAAFVASGSEAPKPGRPDVFALRPLVSRSRAAMERVASLISSGAVRPPNVRLFDLSEAPEAHRLSESRHFRGKLVFQIRRTPQG